MLIPAIVLLTLALVFWFISARAQKQSGLPDAPVAYDDASASRVVPPVLRDHSARLVGRPDYLLKENGLLIPVEVKPSRRARQPYASDTMQLAAYCRLVEAHYGKRPTHGLLRYAADTFEIPYTAALERQLLDTLELMADAERTGTAHRSHSQPFRCRACSQRTHCDEALE